MSVFKRAAGWLPAVLAGIGMSALVQADDHVPPLSITSDTKWTLAGSPYVLPCKSQVVVAAGATLSIDPGVTVALPSRKECGSGPGLVIEGTLAAGSPSAATVFTSLTGDIPAAGGKDFKSAIEFRPGSTGSLVVNARFGSITYETDTEISVDAGGSPVEVQFGGVRARLAAVASSAVHESYPAAASLPFAKALRGVQQPSIPLADPPPLWFPADMFTGELAFGIAPSHNEIDLNRCHAGLGNCNAYASFRLRTNLAMRLFGRGPLSHFVALLDADTFFGDNHPGVSYSLSAPPTMLEHTVGLRVELPRGFWVEAVNHQNHWFGRYANSLGPLDLGPNGPFGQYALFSVGHKFQLSPRPWLTGIAH